MDIAKVVAELRRELERINTAIASLERLHRKDKPRAASTPPASQPQEPAGSPQSPPRKASGRRKASIG